MNNNMEIIEATGALENLRPKDIDMLKKCGSKLGSSLCGVLRHSPERIGVEMNKQGWVLVEELIKKFNDYNVGKKYYLTLPVLMEIVRTDGKQRYGLKYEGKNLMIRCRQGHSIPWIEMDFQKAVPPAVLYHGTINTVCETIMSEGLKPMSRQKVHLSVDLPTALKVAGRRRNQGVPIVFWVKAEQMVQDGVEFYLSENGVWMTDYVAPKYLAIRNIPLQMHDKCMN